MNPVLVTGATGTVGAHVVRAAAATRPPVRAFVRDPEKATRLLGPEAELVVGDFADPDALRAAVDGVERGLPRLRQPPAAGAVGDGGDRRRGRRGGGAPAS